MQQHPFYGRACVRLGARARMLVLDEGGQASAQILERRWPLFGRFALLARGPVWHGAGPDMAQVRVATMRLIQQLRSQYRGVIATPERIAGVDPLAQHGLLPMVTSGSQARLMLDGSAEDRLSRQHGKWRNRLRKAQQAGLVVRHGVMPAEDGHWLLRLEEAQSKTRRYKRLSSDFTLAWARENGKGSTRLFTARHKGEVVAAMLFLLHGQSASYHIGWSGAEGRAVDAHTLLLWQAAEWLAQRGFAFVDLGTLDTESTPGLARFKLGSGAVPVPLGNTWLEAPGARMVARITGHGAPKAMTAGAKLAEQPG